MTANKKLLDEDSKVKVSVGEGRLEYAKTKHVQDISNPSVKPTF